MVSNLRSLIGSFLQSMTHAVLDVEPMRIAETGNESWRFKNRA